MSESMKPDSTPIGPSGGVPKAPKSQEGWRKRIALMEPDFKELAKGVGSTHNYKQRLHEYLGALVQCGVLSDFLLVKETMGTQRYHVDEDQEESLGLLSYLIRLSNGSPWCQLNVHVDNGEGRAF